MTSCIAPNAMMNTDSVNCTVATDAAKVWVSPGSDAR